MTTQRTLAFTMTGLLIAACSSSTPSSTGGTGGSQSGSGGANLVGSGGAGGTNFLGSGGSGGGSSVEMFPELWYSVDKRLVLVTLNKNDGSVANIQSSAITLPLDNGYTAITMLEDGSLLFARFITAKKQTKFYHIPKPPRDGSDVEPLDLGAMPGGIELEGLYTDCEGRIYGMDTGADNTSATGNRLLRFTGDVTAGNFAFVVVSDLATADVADIDDMSPGIKDNQVTDNPGLAIDSGTIHRFNYETGHGTEVAKAGTYGIHALGGSLFTDKKSRLYVMNANAELFMIDPIDFSSSGVLGKGPVLGTGSANGWSGLAGPLTNCETGFTPPK